MQTRLNKGFTLIELLVVIAIIGILSGIVLTSLSSARSKANDAKVKSQLSSIRSAAEIYYSDNNDYGSSVTSCTSGMFADTDGGMSGLVSDDNYPANTTLACHSDGEAWAVSANLSTSGQYWCVDSTGASIQTTAAVSGTACQ